MRLNDVARQGIKERMNQAFNNIYRIYVREAEYDRHEVARQMKRCFDAFEYVGYKFDEPEPQIPAVQIAYEPVPNDAWADWSRFCAWSLNAEGMAYVDYCEAHPIHAAKKIKAEPIQLPLPG
jgi:hypothetical protein